MSGKGKQSSKKAVVKGRESGKTAQSSLVNHTDTSGAEAPEPMMSLTVLKTVDNSRDLPKYTELLNRTEEEGIQKEDIDALQLELEMLLSSAVVRCRTLQEEITNLSSAEERRDRRSKSGKSLSLLDKKVREEKLKPKEISTKSQSPLHTKLFKQKAVGNSANQAVPSVHEIARIEGTKDAPKLLLPKNDTPNKFWASVDPYCTDIMPDDIKLLEELIVTHGDTSDFKKIPQLGRHYSLMWAHNDLLQEEDAANPSREKKKNRTDVSHLMSKGDKKVNSIGPLTQRLVSAFLEENVYIGNNNTENKLLRDGDSTVLRDLSIQNSMNLELRMHKELVEQGILEPDAQKKNQEDDEILAEIKRCQQELSALSSHNVTQLKRLLNLAQEESKRQALKRKISGADNEVIEHYKKLTLAKQMKMPLTKKDQDKAWACLRARENLLEQLNVTK
ncbi:PREDICTED: transcriptional adapter 3-A [Dinoponera quadriceps]|uniref:Transcriptional adapter 3-A n=1 Tax=Dinoponera quadriceps TaxID=609295 RepID=A0A6P3YAQ4_DINQU|nr:PREDICTED: transcriptional adapter 3-A [Dinoponera quadriceps]